MPATGGAPGPPGAPTPLLGATCAAEAGATPLQRSSTPEEIAAAVLYLAGARAVTGQMIAVDSGQHLAWRTADIVSD